FKRKVSKHSSRSFICCKYYCLSLLCNGSPVGRRSLSYSIFNRGKLFCSSVYLHDSCFTLCHCRWFSCCCCYGCHPRDYHACRYIVIAYWCHYRRWWFIESFC